MRKALIFLFLLFLRNYTSSKETLPVLIMDHDHIMKSLSIDPNPFKIIATDYFIELALDAIKSAACIVIFVEDSLSIEDISMKSVSGTPFHNLQKGIKDKAVLYLPSVPEPYALLTQIFEPKVANIFHIGKGEKVTNLNQQKYIYVYLEDDSVMSRVESLKKHDKLMKEVYNGARQLKGGPILAFYTGKKNFVTFETQIVQDTYSEAPLEVEDDSVTMVTPDALFRLSGIISSTKTRRSAVETPVLEHEMRSRRSLSTTMLVTGHHMQFNFQFDDHSWSLANIALLEADQEVGRTETIISAPWQRSYYCSEPITVYNMRDGSTITISEYQIEPIIGRRRDDSELEDGPVFRGGTSTNSPTEPTGTDIPGYCYFSKAINCGPYFNTVILSGLLVFMIFMTITFWGVIMIYNCGVNSRYDDPNEKSLIISEPIVPY